MECILRCPESSVFITKWVWVEEKAIEFSIVGNTERAGDVTGAESF
jgi:hypothetical protein